MFKNQEIKMAIINLSFFMKNSLQNPNWKNHWHEMILKNKEGSEMMYLVVAWLRKQ